MQPQLLMSKADFLARFGTCEQDNPSHDAWLTLAQEILSHWDGKSAATFLAGLTHGQYAIVCLAKLHRAVIRDHDLFSFIGYSMAFAARVPTALEIVGAAEYVRLWNDIADKFPGDNLPQTGDDLRIVMERLPSSVLPYLKEVGGVFATGKGMQRPMQAYVESYIVAHATEFYHED
jgi:hypothetical protein